MAARPRRGAIVVVGSYNRDMGIHLDRHPMLVETVLAEGFVPAPGGKGSNQTVQAARCGAATAMIATVGSDDEGDAALALWSQQGIDTRAIRRVTGALTGTAIILVDRFDENQNVLVPGANGALDPAAVSQAVDASLLADAALVVAQLETPGGRFARGSRSGTRRRLPRLPVPRCRAIAIRPRRHRGRTFPPG